VRFIVHGAGPAADRISAPAARGGDTRAFEVRVVKCGPTGFDGPTCWPEVYFEAFGLAA